MNKKYIKYLESKIEYYEKEILTGEFQTTAGETIDIAPTYEKWLLKTMGGALPEGKHEVTIIRVKTIPGASIQPGQIPWKDDMQLVLTDKGMYLSKLSQNDFAPHVNTTRRVHINISEGLQYISGLWDEVNLEFYDNQF